MSVTKPAVSASGRCVVMLTKLILLIDDEASVREVTQACLNDLGGWNVLAVASAQEGLQYLAVEQPDAIIVDVLMPGMDGITFIHKLRESRQAKPIPPVILFTVRASWFSCHELQQLGAVAAIAKPFNPATLSDQVAHFLGWNLSEQKILQP